MLAMDWFAVGPVAALAFGALAVLATIIAFGNTGGRAERSAAGIAFAASLGSLGLAAAAFGQDRQTLCSGPQRCSYQVGSLGLSLQLLIGGATAICLLLLAAERARPEAHFLTLSAAAGASLLAGVQDLGGLLVALETASLPVVGLVALSGTRRAAEASLKLLLTSVVSLSISALGAALFYATTGSLYLSDPISDDLGDLAGLRGLAIALLLAGVAFKLSLAPFHWWTPEVYAAAPSSAAAFLGTVGKCAGFAALAVILGSSMPDQAASWTPVVGAVAVITMTVGNLAAWQQDSAIRLLAWSAVAQAGWITLPLVGAREPSQIPAALGASVSYLIAYTIGSLAVFVVFAMISTTSSAGIRHDLGSYVGLWQRQRTQAIVLTFGLLCLAGLPPGLMGLVAKIIALRPAVQVGAWWLVGLAIGNIVLGIAVYLRWIRRVLEPAVDRSPMDSGPMARRLAMSISLGACVGLSVLPEGLLALLR